MQTTFEEFQILTHREHLNHLLRYDCNVTRYKVSLDWAAGAIPNFPRVHKKNFMMMMNIFETWMEWSTSKCLRRTDFQLPRKHLVAIFAF